MSKARKRKFYLKLSDFLLDLAKLIFGGIILTGIIDLEINKALLFITGSAVATILAVWGFVLYNRGTKTN
ncbi:MAG: ABC transporter permease [Prevotella sp.]|nr:ABC transporter permease [Prevotella sp.]